MLKRHHMQDTTSRGLLLRNIVVGYFVILLTVGVVLIVSSICIIAQMVSTCEDINKSGPPAFLTLSAGILLVLISMLAVKLVRGGNSQHHMRMYASVLTIALVLNVTAAVLSAVHSQQIGPDTSWSVTFLKHLLLYPSHLTSQNCMDDLQSVFLCCGVNNYTEWSRINISSSNSHANSSFPETCACRNTRALCGAVMTSGSTVNVYSSPCLPKMQKSLSVDLTVTLVISSLACFLQVALTLCLLYTVNKVHNSSVIGSYIVHSGRSESHMEICGEMSFHSVVSVQSAHAPPAIENHQAATRDQDQNLNVAVQDDRSNRRTDG